MILVLAQDSDDTADMVTDALNARRAEFVRLDTSSFPQTTRLDAHPDSISSPGSLTICGREVQLTDIHSVYRRHPAPFDLPADLSDVERRFALREAEAGFAGTLAIQDWRWIDHPSAVADASYKPTQLRRAAECGLRVPPSIVTNDVDRVRAFAEAMQDDIVYKTLTSGAMTEAGRLKIIYTTRLGTAELSQIEDRAIASTCHLFQRWVPKKFDVRLTVVGSSFFAVAVHARSPRAHVDWRACYGDLDYEVITDVPPDVRHGVLRYLAASRLTFGAFDFSVAIDGAWWYLECNPAGQWGWISDETGLPIADAIAAELVR